MAVGPAHRHLKNGVQPGQAGVAGNLEPPPNGRLGAEQNDSELVAGSIASPGSGFDIGDHRCVLSVVVICSAPEERSGDGALGMRQPTLPKPLQLHNPEGKNLSARRLAGELDERFFDAHDLGFAQNQVAITALGRRRKPRETVRLDRHPPGR